MIHYLTRAVLNRKAPEHALRSLLDPANRDMAFDAHHRLVWTLFPGHNAVRDFLWRTEGKGKFMILSARQPQNSCLFEPLESKPFAPVLRTGDQLAFMLRANATRDRRSDPQDDIAAGAGRRSGKDHRVDVVMHWMREQERGSLSISPRAYRRTDAAEKAGQHWLASQGTRKGFSVDRGLLTIEDYRVIQLKRRSGGHATFGTLDFRGLLTVRDPEVFIEALIAGFGRAKAYGCGLMLIRRA